MQSSAGELKAVIKQLKRDNRNLMLELKKRASYSDVIEELEHKRNQVSMLIKINAYISKRLKETKDYAVHASIAGSNQSRKLNLLAKNTPILVGAKFLFEVIQLRLKYVYSQIQGYRAEINSKLSKFRNN